jgi:uncharacterized membrane protein HdeD (DUF308 family)
MNTYEVFDKEVRHNWGWLVALGIVWIIVGALAIAAAGLATLTTVMVFGWVLVFAGIVRGIHAFTLRVREGFFLDLLLGILQLVVGLLIIAMPLASVASLTLLLAAYFCVAGLYCLGFGFSTRLPGRGWIVLNGLIALALGILIFLQWPSSSVWVIGTSIGIDLVFEGWAMVALGLAIHRGLPAPEERSGGTHRPLGA